jgi:hypothetical protein
MPLHGTERFNVTAAKRRDDDKIMDRTRLKQPRKYVIVVELISAAQI